MPDQPQDRLADEIQGWKRIYAKWRSCPASEDFVRRLIARVETQDRLLAKAQESISDAFEDGKNRAADKAYCLIRDQDEAKAVAATIRALKEKP